jgi:hypothetical protein
MSNGYKDVSIFQKVIVFFHVELSFRVHHFHWRRVHLEVNRKSPWSGKCETGVLVFHASDSLKCMSIGDVSFLCFVHSRFCQVTQAAYISLTIIAHRGGFFDVKSMFFLICSFWFCFCFIFFLFFCFSGIAARQMRAACAFHL